MQDQPNVLRVQVRPDLESWNCLLCYGNDACFDSWTPSSFLHKKADDAQNHHEDFQKLAPHSPFLWKGNLPTKISNMVEDFLGPQNFKLN